MYKSSLLLCCMCTGGNITQFGAGLEVLVFVDPFLISMFYSFVSLYSIIFLLLLCYVCVPQVDFWMDRARAYLALPH